MQTLEQLLDDYVLTMRSERYSPRTIETAQSVLRSAIKYWSNGTPAMLEDFNLSNGRRYLVYLQEERERYEGHQFAPTGGRLSPHTVHLHARNLRAFSSWLEREEYRDENVLARMRLPRLPQDLIVPLTDEECGQLLRAFKRSTVDGTRGYAILMVLLDTGVRASELCGLRLSEVDLDNGECRVHGKGGKERSLALGYQTLKAVRRYVRSFRPAPRRPDDDHIFLSRNARPLTRGALVQVFQRLRNRSGVERVHPHLCRHTFALAYLRNGGDVFSLQRILGHSSLKMVSNYLTLSSADILERHRQFSPMDRLAL